MAEDQDQGSGTDQNDDGGTDDQNDEGTGSGQDGGEGGGEGEQDSGGDDSQETVSKADWKKLFARMQAADRAKGVAEAKLREKEQAEMSELDRTKSQLEEAAKAKTEADDRLKAMVIENAFHRENKFTWHDVADAVAALDLSGVEVGEDGKVTGMAAAIKDVAKRKPHYVKSEDKDGTGLPAANGAHNGQRKGKETETVDKAKLVARFPALGK